jgi:hypothetical protein
MLLRYGQVPTPAAVIARIAIKALLITAPAGLREQLGGLPWDIATPPSWS